MNDQISIGFATDRKKIQHINKKSNLDKKFTMKLFIAITTPFFLCSRVVVDAWSMMSMKTGKLQENYYRGQQKYKDNVKDLLFS
jgi:hypothetical protein